MMVNSADVQDFEQQCRIVYAYLNQGKTWVPKDRSPLDVADMDSSWRRNAARWMERRAAWYAAQYTMGEFYALGTPSLRTVVAEIDGVAIERGPLVSELDLMSDHVHDAMDAWQAERDADPVVWIRTTDLYRALVADLPAVVPA